MHMKKNILSMIFLIVVILSCNKFDLPKDTPDCIIEHIKRTKKDKCCISETIYKYTYNGTDLYYFETNCPCRIYVSEVYIPVIDEKCNILFNSSDTLKWNDFIKYRTNEKIIYKYERKR